MVTMTVGSQYKNRLGHSVRIAKELTEGDLGYDKGMRFMDDQGSTYRPDGGWSIIKTKKVNRDLVDLIS